MATHYGLMELSQFNGKLSRLFYRRNYPFSYLGIPDYRDRPYFADTPRFLSAFARLLHSGEDIHQSLHRNLLLQDNLSRTYRRVQSFDLQTELSHISFFDNSTIMRPAHFNILMQNGLSFF